MLLILFPSCPALPPPQPTFEACVACTTPTIVHSYFDCCKKSYILCEACTMQLRYCCPTCFPHHILS